MMRIGFIVLLIAAFVSLNPVHAAPGDSFELADADGRTLLLPDEQEGVGLYLFWASWCPYCRALMPHLQSLVDEYPDALTVYALNFRDQDDPRAYLEDQGFEFRLLPAADAVAESWSVRGTPGLFLIDEAGQICFDLYSVLTENPAGWDALNHRQRAARRAPFWAAELRKVLVPLLRGDRRC